MWIDKDATDGTQRSFGFIPPAGATEEKNEVLFPFHETQDEDYAAEINVDIAQMESFLDIAELTGNTTLNLTIDAQLTKGAKLHLKTSADATVGGQDITLGTGFDADAADITVAASAYLFRSFVYDGTAFRPMYQ